MGIQSILIQSGLTSAQESQATLLDKGLEDADRKESGPMNKVIYQRYSDNAHGRRKATVNEVTHRGM